MKIASWVESANVPEADFPLNNLPLGVCSAGEGPRRCCVALGDRVILIDVLDSAGLLPDAARGRFSAGSWNATIARGDALWNRVRDRLIALFRTDGPTDLRDNARLRAEVLLPMAEVTLHMPFDVAEYTDFYAGRHHAANVGTMFRGAENALPPNWLHMPIGYNGRASSVVVSGQGVRRPWGQLKGKDHDAPIFAPSRRFDFELEMGAIVGVPSEGPVTVAEADAMIFGYVLLNDWSARDIQAWEYVPLGPFQAKATATTISPWIVTKAALEPFRCAPPARELPLLPHLQDAGPANYDIALEVALAPEGGAETVISRSNARELYYSAAQQLAHHTTCGCPMRSGDLLGSGTISGAGRESRGSLLELSWGGETPVELQGGGTRTFLEDGDTLTLRGHAQGEDYRIGFGDCAGQLLPALDDPYKRN